MNEMKEALRRFVSQRSGIDARNYGGSREAFMQDYRRILRDGRDARVMLRAVIPDYALADALKSGRLTWDGKRLEFTACQYFPPKARAYPMTPDGLHQMALDAQEERGMAELAAVGAAPADWPNDGRGDKDGLRQLLRAPTLGDFVTVASGLTGMVMAIGDGWVEVRFIDGRVIEVPTQSVEVVDVD